MTAPAAGTEVSISGNKTYANGHRVLTDIDMTFPAGSVSVLIGPSGSGKTTLLRALGLLIPLDAGSCVRLDGHLHGYQEGSKGLTPLPERKLTRPRMDVGMVFQHFNLFPHKTALENVMLGPTLVQGRSKAQVRSEAVELLGRVGLAAHVDAYPARLSGGQQQRVAIARALAMRPKVMLFDEPTSALDPEMVHEVLNVMAELASSGMTMVIASHEMGFARRAADRVVFMDGGRVLESNDPEAFFAGTVPPRVQAFIDKIL